MGLEILWVILSLVGVLGLFFIMVYATKKLNSGIGYVNGNRMKVVDRISLGRDGMLVVVSVAGTLMLVGVTGQHDTGGIQRAHVVPRIAERYELCVRFQRSHHEKKGCGKGWPQ